MTIPTGPAEPPPRELVAFRRPGPALTALDVSIGAGAAAVHAASRLAGIAAYVVRPVAGVLMRPPLLDRALTPAALLKRIADHGAEVRVSAGADVEVASRVVVPAVADAVVERLDLTDLVLTQVDLARIVEAALDRIDLTELVLQRVDLGRVVDAVLDRLDLTDLVLTRVDLVRVVEAVLDGLDLTELVQQRVDLDAVAAGLDADAVAARMDLVGIADYIVDAIDLTEIIRSSTGSVATEAMRGARMQSVEADAQVQRIVDRVLLRRKARRTEAPEDKDHDFDGEAPT